MNIFELTKNIFDAIQFNKSIIFNDLRTNDNIESISSIHKAQLILSSVGLKFINDGNSIFITIYDDTPIVEASRIVKEKILKEKMQNIEKRIEEDIVVLYEPLLSSIELENMVDTLVYKYGYPVFMFTDDKIPGLIHGIAKNNKEMDVKELAGTAENLYLKYGTYQNTLNIIAHKSNFDEIKNNLLCAYEEKIKSI